MSDLLSDSLNLDILEHICSGSGVEVNINALSKTFGKHRNTIKSHVNDLFENNIIRKPVYPFMWLFKEYPLLVAVRSELPRDDHTQSFFRDDPHIFGVFYVRDEEYNTLLIEFHKDLYSYAEWRKMIVVNKAIPARETRYPSSSYHFDCQQIVKYQPFSPVYDMEERMKAGESMEMNGYRMNDLAFKIQKRLLMGQGIRTNENFLSRELNVHRKTIERRLKSLIREGVVDPPACRFPKFFVPPDHFLVFCLLEVKKSKDRLIKAFRQDPHIPFASEANVGRYNMLLLKAFNHIEDHFTWEERYDTRFPGCIGAMKKIFMSPNMTEAIDQQKVSLGIIRSKKEMLRGRELIASVSAPYKGFV